MQARALFQDGNLDGAIEALNADLRSDPTDRQRRTFLFELLCFSGAYERAEKQLDVIAEGGPDAAMGALLYQSALHGERIRQDMFGTRDFPGGGATLEPVSGTLNGNPFDTLEDADPRVGARFEVFVAGQYTWLPMRQVSTLRMEAPRRLRDLLWAPAAMTTTGDFEGDELGEILLPVLAPLSWSHSNDAVRLGRMTEWVDLEGQPTPFGQKLLLVDGEEFPILELRELEIAPAVDSSS
ncbi:MAG: type VI secretion system accessory protein TagJ [Gemmatimonadota bacterium]|jgi:type VI secretion system protein ImpE